MIKIDYNFEFAISFLIISKIKLRLRLLDCRTVGSDEQYVWPSVAADQWHLTSHIYSSLS